MNKTSALVGGLITLLLVAGIGGIVVGLDQMDDSPINQVESDNQTTEDPAPETQQPVNESEVPQVALDSEAGAADLKRAFQSEYDYENRVMIQRDGQVVLHYNSTAQNGNQLKDEMKQVALLYADAAAENPDVGALTIQANGVLLTVPADTAIAHGNGNINEEAYFENVRFDSMNSTDS